MSDREAMDMNNAKRAATAAILGLGVCVSFGDVFSEFLKQREETRRRLQQVEWASVKGPDRIDDVSTPNHQSSDSREMDGFMRMVGERTHAMNQKVGAMLHEANRVSHFNRFESERIIAEAREFIRAEAAEMDRLRELDRQSKIISIEDGIIKVGEFDGGMECRIGKDGLPVVIRKGEADVGR